jgi:serine/threonine-protein kinase
MKQDPDIVDVIRAIASGSSVDWDSVAATPADASIASVLTELKIIARIADVHGSSRSDARIADGDEDAQLHTWGPLTILERVGRGAYGDVFRAWDSRLDRDVALKLLRRSIAVPADGSQVIEEGRLLARVRHPNVLTVHGAECIDGRIGIWTEFVEGRTLQQIVADTGPLPATDVVTIGTDICRALAAVHRAGLVHRDIKAQNVMRDDSGRIVLMDFGTTRLAEGEPSGLAGTPLYLAPEVLGGGPATPASDIYAAGVLLYYLLTGRHPVEGTTLDDVRASHAVGGASGNSAHRLDAPRALTRAISGALQSDPARRFPSADAMADALGTGPRRSRPLTFTAAAVGLVAAAVLLVLTTTGRGSRLATRGPSSSAPASPSPSAAMPSARRLPFPDAMLSGNGFSFDGRYYSYADVRGNLNVLEVDTNEPHTIVAADGDRYAEMSVMSPDGELIAYQSSTPQGTDLRVVGRDGSRPRTLIAADGIQEPLPLAWSQDGSRILVMLIARDAARRIALVPLTTGKVAVVREFREHAPVGVSLSRDGRFVAYDLPGDDAQSKRQLYVVNSDGTGDHRVFDVPHGDDRYPLWTPDGGGLFFISNRSGAPDGWLVSMHEGSATGEPALAVRNLAHVRSLGFTASGSYYYQLRTGAPDVFEVALPGGDAAATSRPRVIPDQFNGANMGPAYSRDGEFLAYVSLRESISPEHGDRVLVVRDVRSGTERQVPAPLTPGIMPPRWAADGRRLLVHGTNRRNEWGLFVVDANTGSIEHQTIWSALDMADYGWACWAPDDHAILFEQARRGIVRHDVPSGRESILFPYPRDGSVQRIRRFGVSADGRRLALTEITRDGATIIVVVEDGRAREIARAVRPQSVVFQSWAPGDEAIYYTSFALNNMKQPHELWRAPSSGGSAERIVTIPGNTQQNPIAFSPDGTTVAYTAGVPSEQLWIMEHFLSSSR